jgi:glycosyltransferase involved in cell wall biosynthesis
MRTVDVVIPCYNYARYLPGCVRSVLSQVGVDLRILIIDDASSDETAQVGNELAASSRSVEFRSHAVNKGHIATYNEGLLGWSSSDYVVLLSADDLLTPGSLIRAVGVMEADKSIGLVYGSTIHFADESELPRSRVQRFTHTRWTGTEWLEARCKAGYNVITSPEVVVRGSVQRAVGGYSQELPHAGDLEMWMRIAAVSNIAYIKGPPQAYYRVHPRSMMRTVYRGSLVDLRQRQVVFDRFFQLHANAISSAAMLYEMARCALAKEALWDACRAYDRNEVDTMCADELEDFALDTYAQAKALPEYNALNRRRNLGPELCKRTQIFAAPALVRKIDRWRLKRRWMTQGI